MSLIIHPDTFGAFMPDAFGALPSSLQKINVSDDGALQGKRLAVKDIYEIEGLVTGVGSPIYAAKRAPSQYTATAVQLLLEAGAVWRGKTVTDEMTYSVAGINTHYGTPINPAAPDRLCGGSSSGSAVAVASGQADIGLGSDCGGSIRLPASYCGIYSFRPSHSRIAINGCFTLAHSFDTVGWLTADLETLISVFEVLTSSQVARETSVTSNWVVSDDIEAELDPAVLQAFNKLLQRITSVQILDTGTLDLHHWQSAFRILQGAEICQHHGNWARHHAETLGADIRGRFEQAATITASEVAAAARVRADVIRILGTRLNGADTFLLLPTVPGSAPELGASADEVDQTRTRSMRMLCIAGLAGLPQVTLPWIEVDGAPVGLSMIGPRGSDEQLLAASRDLQSQIN